MMNDDGDHVVACANFDFTYCNDDIDRCIEISDGISSVIIDIVKDEKMDMARMGEYIAIISKSIEINIKRLCDLPY